VDRGLGGLKSAKSFARQKHTLKKICTRTQGTMHVLMIGHAQIKSFQDPDLPSAYDRYQLKINDKAAALVREAADAVLFARFKTELVRDGRETLR
jgi:hypothetical protein